MTYCSLSHFVVAYPTPLNPYFYPQGIYDAFPSSDMPKYDFNKCHLL